LLSISIVACNPVATKQPADAKPLNYDSLKTVLLITDANFSDLSSKKGVHESFTTYIADDGAMLRPNRMPIISKDSLRVYFSNRPDTGYTLIWTPLFSDISKSGDLGYTYGTYKLTVKSSKEMEEGTYATVWKQDPSGNWKFVLDTGNPGLKPEKQVSN
jgi:ketosteroid isomerase-like protein